MLVILVVSAAAAMAWDQGDRTTAAQQATQHAAASAEPGR
jgi:hypothetical protein